MGFLFCCWLPWFWVKSISIVRSCPWAFFYPRHPENLAGFGGCRIGRSSNIHLAEQKFWNPTATFLGIHLFSFQVKKLSVPQIFLSRLGGWVSFLSLRFLASAQRGGPIHFKPQHSRFGCQYRLRHHPFGEALDGHWYDGGHGRTPAPLAAKSGWSGFPMFLSLFYL